MTISSFDRNKASKRRRSLRNFQTDIGESDVAAGHDISVGAINRYLHGDVQPPEPLQQICKHLTEKPEGFRKTYHHAPNSCSTSIQSVGACALGSGFFLKRNDSLPMYCFRLRRGESEMIEEHGAEFADDRTACVEALRIAKEIALDRAVNGADLALINFQIARPNGWVLDTIPLELLVRTN